MSRVRQALSARPLPLTRRGLRGRAPPPDRRRRSLTTCRPTKVRVGRCAVAAGGGSGRGAGRRRLAMLRGAVLGPRVYDASLLVYQLYTSLDVPLPDGALAPLACRQLLDPMRAAVSGRQYAAKGAAVALE